MLEGHFRIQSRPGQLASPDGAGWLLLLLGSSSSFKEEVRLGEAEGATPESQGPSASGSTAHLCSSHRFALLVNEGAGPTAGTSNTVARHAQQHICRLGWGRVELEAFLGPWNQGKDVSTFSHASAWKGLSAHSLPRQCV